jgi:DNA repair exonuclease SbcCD nuclease subunit
MISDDSSTLTIFLTADVHLGMTFSRYERDAKNALIEGRFTALERCVAAANKRASDLLVVAGDLFDRQTVAADAIERAAAALNAFDGVVAVLAGNHDYYSPDSALWKRFRNAAADNVLLLENASIYDLRERGLDVALYAAPCDRKHADDNRVGWIAGAERDEEIAFHIGVAHGSVEGLSADDEGRYFPMTRRELADANLDLWLLGHADRLHYPTALDPDDVLFNPGSPEPTGFHFKGTGEAWALEIDERKRIVSESVRVGATRYKEIDATLADEADVERIEKALVGKEAGVTLARVVARGELDESARTKLRKTLDRLERELFHLEANLDGIVEPLDQSAIDRDYQRDSFPWRLTTALLEANDPDAARAARSIVEDARR